MATVPTFTPGAVATQGDLAWGITTRPLGEKTSTTVQAAANNSWTTCNLTTTALDRDTGFTGTGYTVGKTLGLYMVTAAVTFAASTGGTTRQARIALNGGQVPSGWVEKAAPALSGPFTIVIGPVPIVSTSSTDVVTVQALQDSGGSLNVTAAELTVEFLGTTNVLLAPVASTTSASVLDGAAPTPAVPVFGTSTTSTYQPTDGFAQAVINLTWAQPLNVDGTTDTFGDHYEVQYRATSSTGDWTSVQVGWDKTGVGINQLNVGTSYDFQIRAVNGAGDNIAYGAWSATLTVVSSTDVTAPGQPAPPTVAASLIAYQVTHTLGLNSGGTYNLPPDLSHLEVHASVSGSGFTPDATTLAGKLQADAGMLTSGIPAVGTFQTSQTAGIWVKVVAVDRSGNRSTPSNAASVTTNLIDDSHVSNLNVSKLVAGTMSAAVILGGSIKTATTGARVEIDGSGIRAYNSSGTNTVNVDASSGSATLTGTVQTGLTGKRIQLDPTGAGSGNPTIWFWPTTGTNSAYINNPDGGQGIGVNTGTGPATSGTVYARMFLTPVQSRLQTVNLDQTRHGGSIEVTDTNANVSATSATAVVRADALWDTTPLVRHRTYYTDATTVLAETNLTNSTVSLYSSNTSGARRADAIYDTTPLVRHRTYHTDGTTVLAEVNLTGSTATIGSWSSTGGQQSNLTLNSTDAQLHSYNGSGGENGRLVCGGTDAYIQFMNGTGNPVSKFLAATTGSYVQAFSGGTLVAQLTVDSSGNCRLEAKGGSNYTIVGINGGTYAQFTGNEIDLVANTIAFGTGSGTDVVKSDSIYNRTATFSANVGISTSPASVFYRLTSSARYKVEITPADLDVDDVLRLAPVTYFDRGQAEEQDGSVEGLSQQLGLIAEEVAAIPGIGHLLVELDAGGRPESVNYERVACALIPVIRDLRARVAALEGTRA